jgi:uncharacterized protein DUF4410
MKRAAGMSWLAVLLGLVLSGCGAVSHETSLLPNYVPEPGSRIEVGTVTNVTGQVPKVDDEVVNIEQLLTDALDKKLRGEDLLWSAPPSRKLVLISKIVEYEPGDAFKRWLLPGWGSTVVSVEGELRDANRLVGTVRARRTVSFGGGYTIGAWRTIFASIADDIVSELREKIRK